MALLMLRSLVPWLSLCEEAQGSMALLMLRSLVPWLSLCEEAQGSMALLMLRTQGSMAGTKLDIPTSPFIS